MEIYHITHINNLPAILEAEGLCANSQLQPNQYTDIAYGDIQHKRSQFPVPYAAGGKLHDYVPFYFAPRSPMLNAIHNGRVAGYQDGQENIVHLAVNVETIDEYGLSFTFTDGHATVAYSTFYDDLQDLNKIDWAIMKARYWSDTPDDSDRRRRRQAEFLVHKCCPWDFVTKIGVINSNIRNQVCDLLQQYNDRTPVNVYPDWYY